METITNSAGSKPAPETNEPPANTSTPYKGPMKHVRVFDETHAAIMKNTSILEIEYIKRAKALNIPVRKRGQFANTPGQAEAMEYFFAGITMDEYIDRLIARTKSKITKWRKGAV